MSPRVFRQRVTRRLTLRLVHLLLLPALLLPALLILGRGVFTGPLRAQSPQEDDVRDHLAEEQSGAEGQSEENEQPSPHWVYFGTYTARTSKGIYASQFDPASGSLSDPVLVAETEHPSYLAWDPSRHYLYAVNETSEYEGEPTGYVTAFARQEESESLSELNRMPSGGAAPCHLVVDPEGRNVLVANYGSGTLAVLGIGEDGRLRERRDLEQHEGHSVNNQRQEGPHAHCINLDRSGRWALSADLGIDQVLVYRYQSAAGTLTAAPDSACHVQPGAGPRHLAVHPSRPWMYVINELDSTIVALRFEPSSGKLQTVQTISTLPEEFRGTSFTAEVFITPDGKWLYGSNRGHDSLAAFGIDGETGELRSAGIFSTQGRTPRSFGIDPSGRYLLAANQDSDSVVVFSIDGASGRLEQIGQPVSVPMPVCVLFR